MIRVYLKIEGQADNALCVVRGCGAWGEAETEARARQIARRELRSAFGPGLIVKELVEQVEEAK